MNTVTDKKAHLLSTGMAVIFRKGYHATGVQDIVDAAGVPKGSFYNYFDSKEAFAVEGVTSIAEQGQACARATLTDVSVAPIQRVLNYFEQALHYQTANGFCGGCLIGNLCQEMADDSPAMRSRIDLLMSGHIRLLAQCFAEAQQQGSFHNTRSAEDTAEFVFYAWEGALMRMKASKSEQALLTFMRVLKTVCAGANE